GGHRLQYSDAELQSSCGDRNHHGGGHFLQSYDYQWPDAERRKFILKFDRDEYGDFYQQFRLSADVHRYRWCNSREWGYSDGRDRDRRSDHGAGVYRERLFRSGAKSQSG